MLKSTVIIEAIVITLLISSVSNVFATGLRHDPGDDATPEQAKCFINGYDSGFAGKYDKDRAEECVEHKDQYNEMWDVGCEHSTRTEAECAELINNPVEIEDFKILKGQNDQTCHEFGFEDGKASKPFNEERDDGCYEFGGLFGGYQESYQLGCETHSTQSSCELKYENKSNYCPQHPDVAGCTEFLQNATNKRPEPAYCATMTASVSCFDYREDNPEEYCLEYDSPHCKEVGDLCDDEGFVRPEYPYCTAQVK